MQVGTPWASKGEFSGDLHGGQPGAEVGQGDTLWTREETTTHGISLGNRGALLRLQPTWHFKREEEMDVKPPF